MFSGDSIESENVTVQQNTNTSTMSLKWKLNTLYFANSDGSIGLFDLETMVTSVVARGFLLIQKQVEGATYFLFKKEVNEINCIDVNGTILGSVGRFLTNFLDNTNMIQE